MEHKDSAFDPTNYLTAITFPERLVDPNSWIEHIPFAFYLIQAIHPDIFVELGTLTGNSYCAFCQAVKAFNLKTRCFAIDTWEGDSHTGKYGDEVWENLREHHNVRYDNFSQLIRSSFDEASSSFSDHSIDLLHIDGFHTYDAVKHDYETWYPKLSSRAIVLLHDTNVKINDYGVYIFWDEIKKLYPSFEFLHGHGLGVIAVGSELPMAIEHLFNPVVQDHNISEYFRLLGITIANQFTLQKKTNEMQIDLDKTNNKLQETVQYYSQSKSWKITRPLRFLTNSLKRNKEY